MTNSKTKRALYLSLLSMLVCVAMLIGTTFAWFTDSVSSGINRIIAGSLDIELEYSKDGTTWNSVEGKTDLFGDVALWEPGATSVVYLRLTNKGNLALKYYLTVTATGGDFINVAGESKNLKDALKFAQVAGDDLVTFATREEAVAATASSALGLADYAQTNSMAANDVSYISLVVTMPTTVGNEFNYKTGTPAPEIDLSIVLMATQLAAESDSFDNKYDIGAPWMGGIDEAGLAENTDGMTVRIESAEQFAAFAKAVNNGNDYDGYTIVLERDIDLNNIPWTPIGNGNAAFNGIFDGQNHTILNLKVHSDKNAGLFGRCFNYALIKNIKVVNATVTGHNAAGVILGRGYADLINCDVENATVTVTTWFVNNKWDDGDKAGAVVGQLSDGAYDVQDCDVKNVTIKGYRDIGGIAGYAYASYGTVFTDNTVDGLTLINDRSHNYNNYTTDAQYDVNEIVGEYASTIDVSNTATNVTKKIYYCEGLEFVGGVYEISKGAGLQYAANNFMSKGGIYKLVADIDMTGIPALSVNISTSGTGMTLDGQNHKITGVNVSGESNQGLFATIGGHNATINIKNIIIEAPSVTMTSTNLGGGALMGKTGMGSGITNIENVTVNGGVINGYKYVGGLIGYDAAGGTVYIKNCSVNGTVVAATNTIEGGSSSVGGFIGYSQCPVIFEGDTSTAVLSAQTATKYCGSYIGTANHDDINIKDAVDGNAAVGRTAGHTITVNGAPFTK